MSYPNWQLKAKGQHQGRPQRPSLFFKGHNVKVYWNVHSSWPFMAGNQAPSLNGLCMRPLFSSTPSELLLLLRRHEEGRGVKRVCSKRNSWPWHSSLCAPALPWSRRWSIRGRRPLRELMLRPHEVNNDLRISISRQNDKNFKWASEASDEY